jgi:hypothetical protein
MTLPCELPTPHATLPRLSRLPCSPRLQRQPRPRMLPRLLRRLLRVRPPPLQPQPHSHRNADTHARCRLMWLSTAR